MSRSEPTVSAYDLVLILVGVGATVAFRNEGPVFDLAKACGLLFLTIAAMRGLGRGLVRDSRIPLAPFALAAIVVIALSAVVAAAHDVSLRAWLIDAVGPLAIALSPFAAQTISRAASGRALEITLAAGGLVAAVSYALYWRETRGLTDGDPAAGLASWYVPLGAGVYFAALRRPHGRALIRVVYVGAIIGLLLVSGSRIAVIPVALFCGWLLVRPILVEAHRVTRWRQAAGAAAALAVGVLVLAATGLAQGPGTERFLSSFDLIESGLAEDLSFQERVRETHVAMEAFDESPLIGVGPGYMYEWTTPTGLAKSSTIAETPAGIIADFGLVGGSVLVALIVVIAARSTSRLRDARRALRRAPADEALIVVCVAAVVNAFIASPFDDKGLAIVLVLLLACSLQGARGDTVAQNAQREHSVSRTPAARGSTRETPSSSPTSD